MFQFTIRQLMLFAFILALLLAWPVDRQILWLRMRAEYARCIKANDEHRRVIGTGTFIPYPPDENPYLKAGMWEDRGKLVRELESMTSEANFLESVVKDACARQQRTALSP